MDHPIWMVIPWAILSVAVALKVWRFTRLVRRHLPGPRSELDTVRASLEQIWQKDQQPT
ncbi:MAG: hypothetical protein R6U30_11770 [Halomonas sp.]|uniref:hypothetical protein n=1 Tax=Halomonas sp. TaxID=1486246 RepID=UPI0039710F32